MLKDSAIYKHFYFIPNTTNGSDHVVIHVAMWLLHYGYDYILLFLIFIYSLQRYKANLVQYACLIFFRLKNMLVNVMFIK